MTIKQIGRFRRHFAQRIQPFPNLTKKFYERVQLFLTSSDDPTINDHQLRGSKKEFRAFSITADIRVVYFTKGEDIYFVDIGTHDQIY